MDLYHYETHLHTSEASSCGKSKGYEYIQPYLDRGYSGIFVTDHFFNGNTAIKEILPWSEMVSRFVEGYEQAKEEGDRHGLQVFFGWEHTFNRADFIIYGLDKAWLLAHPEVMHWDLSTLFNHVNEAGGLVVHAHPFRERRTISTIELFPHLVHAIEVLNDGNEAEFDRKAFTYARALGLPITSGSDVHAIEKIKDQPMGMAFDTPLTCIEDFIARVKNRDRALLLGQEDRNTLPHSADTTIPIHLYDETNHYREVSFKQEFLLQI